MGKKWAKHYLLIGTLLIVIVVLAGSLLLVSNNLRKAYEKHVFESFYDDTVFDFKAPSPSFDQVGQEESSASNGISDMIPYYSTSTQVVVNNKSLNCDIQLFPEASKIEKTPYCSSRILDGTSSFSGGEVIVDQVYAKKNNCSIGDNVSFSIRENEFSYKITSISEPNTEYDSGIMAIVLTNSDAQKLMDDNITFSAAYVVATDYRTCKDYLFSDYKPYGRLKDQSEFDSIEVYNRHYENFMGADWSEEITDYSANYNMLKVKYENIDTGIIRNQIVLASIIAITIFVFSVVLLANKDLRKFMQNFIIKKGGTLSQCINYFCSGIIYLFALYTALSAVLYYFLSTWTSKAMLLGGLWNLIIPVSAALVISIIMVIISRAVIGSRFSAKKIQEIIEAEKKRLEAQRRQQAYTQRNNG